MVDPTRSIPNLLALVESTWGYRDLRPLQREAMQAVLTKRDSVVVMPTGGGKSLCYQAPAAHLARNGHGPTIVVSPLIALMKDQVDSLRSLGIAAAQLDSSLSMDERRQVSSDLRSGRLNLLFVSPEKLVGRGNHNSPDDHGAGNGLMGMLREVRAQTFAIDEAHCISHWGHDFRPEYRRLSTLKSLFPGCSIHAFTATATKQVRLDIANQLQLDNPLTLVGNFDRPNLIYRVLPRRDLTAQIQEVLQRHVGEAGIIYCLRRKDVDEIVASLSATARITGRSVMGYHAGMTTERRRQSQEAFACEQCDLIVATIAFGMGINRSNIRFVLHTGIPKSIEAYQQETGRAGRDGLEAECVLLYSAQDIMTWKSLIERSADEAIAAGTTVAPNYVSRAFGQLDEMARFAQGSQCRHQALVEYFGQSYQHPASDAQVDPDQSATAIPSCKACDHCLGDTEPVPDALIIAQKILSAVARTDQRFGAAHIIAVLRGENSEKMRQFRHDRLSVYGLLKDRSKTELRNFTYQLIGQGALAQESLMLGEGRSVSILKLNHASLEVLKSRRQVRLLQLVKKSVAESKRSQPGDVSWQGVDRELFDALRSLRKQIAVARRVAPYLIFSDATLRELARVRPTSEAGFRMIYGIGEAKLKTFGNQMIRFMSDYCATHNVPTQVKHTP